MNDIFRATYEGFVEKQGGKKKTLNLTVESFDNSLDLARKRGYDDALKDFTQSYSAAVCLGLFDKFNFTGEELMGAVEAINGIFDSVCSGYISIDDIQQTLLEEAGVTLRFSRKGK